MKWCNSLEGPLGTKEKWALMQDEDVEMKGWLKNHKFCTTDGDLALQRSKHLVQPQYITALLSATFCFLAMLFTFSIYSTYFCQKCSFLPIFVYESLLPDLIHCSVLHGFLWVSQFPKGYIVSPLDLKYLSTFSWLLIFFWSSCARYHTKLFI